MKKSVRLSAKTYSYLIDDGSEDKKAKGTEKFAIKRKLKFENFKHCFEATQLDNKIKYQEKNEINIDSLKINHKEFIRNNESIQIITLFTFKNLKVKGNMFYWRN